MGLTDELNRDFYEHSPSQYLRTRITLLVAFGDETAPVHQAVRTGIRAWEIGASHDADVDADEIDGFAVVESISILYLAAEAMLRLYFAHAEMTDCPPLRLSSLTVYSRFKKRVDALITNPPSTEELRTVFRGTLTPPADVPPEVWEEDGAVLAFLVRRAAELLVREANVYNATKHGLAVQARKSAIRLGSEDGPGGVILDHDGSSIRFLSRVGSDGNGLEDWRETVQFAFPSTNLTLAASFADEIDAVHAVARGRLFGDGVSYQLHRRALIDQILKVPFKSNYTGILNMAMNREFQVRSCRAGNTG